MGVHLVAVEDVVRGDLVVPAQRAGGEVEGDDRVGVEVVARAARSRSGTRACPGTGPGWRRRRRRGPRSRSIAGGYQAPPPELTSGLPQRSSPSTVSNVPARPRPVAASSALTTPRSPPV